ncbi:UvrD-helicase domain-containing protein [Amycolatopsis sp. VS8301801F10]|uniref:UvrD-helicase domain-containing protein n=1 Tax=Amycolatopsis sp. VS8301801F10 TaxID=2652442 RepID=UPI0038FCB29E
MLVGPDQAAACRLPIAARFRSSLITSSRCGCWPAPHLRGVRVLEEAQDTNSAIDQVFLGQGTRAQLVVVGDSVQAIYGWRGVRDVMTGFAGRQLALSHSILIRQWPADPNALQSTGSRRLKALGVGAERSRIFTREVRAQWSDRVSTEAESVA